MSKSLRALGVVGLAFVGLWYFAGGRMLPLGASETVAAPLAHENLSVYFVAGPDTVGDARVMTLQEALERKLAVVHETSDVNTLAVENRSPDCELFIQSGDIVKGGQQDRVIATDMLLPPGSGRVPLPAHCVEQGRWTNRGTEDAKQFHSSANFAAGKDLKYANASGRQSAVWQTVSDNQGKLRMNVAGNVTENASPTSFQLTLESPAVKAKVAEYEAALKAAGEERANVVGVVFVVNGQITGAEVYGSNALFRKAWPKLLNAAAAEAVAEHTDKPTTARPTPQAVERFLARGADPEPVAKRAHGVEEYELFVENVDLVDQGWARTRGLPRETRTGQLVFGGSVNSDIGLTGNVQTGGQPIARPAPDRTGRIIIEGNEITRDRVVTNQLDLRPGQVANPAPNGPAGQTVNPTAAAPDNVVMGGNGAARVQAAPANTDGNRLNSNRTENRSTLMVESRDPARQNAVIHRSYIKK